MSEEILNEGVEVSEKNLFQRINDVRAAVSYIQKDKLVSAGAGGNYKAVTHDYVTAITRVHMITHGIASYPVLVSSTMNPPLVFPDGTFSKQRLYEAVYDFHFVNVDDPKDEIVIRLEGHAMDNGDKAPGKALSYAKKYAVLKLFEIETGEDDESRVPEPFNKQEHIRKIKDAKTLDELKRVFLDSYRAAGDARDAAAQNDLATAKDERKREIELKSAPKPG